MTQMGFERHRADCVLITTKPRCQLLLKTTFSLNFRSRYYGTARCTVIF